MKNLMRLTADQTQLKNELVHWKIGQKIFRLTKTEEMFLQKTYREVNTEGCCSSSKRKSDPCCKTGDARRNIQQRKDRQVNELQ